MISIFIPTKNEAQDLPGCLESVSWSDDIHVYDCGSTDLTATIASLAGARVTSRLQCDLKQGPFAGNEARHKNWALANIPFKYDWVLHLDADERATPELCGNIRRAVQSPGAHVAFRIRRRDFWRKRWLKHAVTSSFYLRLFRPRNIRYERLINPVSIADGPVGEVSGYLDHYPFSKGMTHWLERHNSYSTLEARQIAQNRAVNRSYSLTQALFGTDPNVRRFHQKEFFYRMPSRPLLKFLFLYVAKRGFLDGGAGFNYAVLQAFYEHMIVLKTKELTAPSKAVAPAKERASVSIDPPQRRFPTIS